MTTIVVARKHGHVAIGADTLSKIGFTNQSADYVENQSKILQFKGNFLAYTGLACWSHVFRSYFGGLRSVPRLDTPQRIFEMAQALHGALREHYYLMPENGHPRAEHPAFESSHYACLLANTYGIFGIYSLRSVQQFTKFFSFGSGFMYALGAMRAIYDHSDSAGDIVRAGLDAAADFDEDTAAPMEIHWMKAHAGG
ncbi:MAG: Ntn hydrolase family protein [Planctomycetota bacterium]